MLGYQEQHLRRVSAQKKHTDSPALLTDPNAYLSFLETQLERVSAACMNVAHYEQRFVDMQALIVQLEAKCSSNTRLLEIAQKTTLQVQKEVNSSISALDTREKSHHEHSSNRFDSAEKRLEEAEEAIVDLSVLPEQIRVVERRVSETELLSKDAEKLHVEYTRAADGRLGELEKRSYSTEHLLGKLRADLSGHMTHTAETNHSIRQEIGAVEARLKDLQAADRDAAHRRISASENDTRSMLDQHRSETEERLDTHGEHMEKIREQAHSKHAEHGLRVDNLSKELETLLWKKEESQRKALERVHSDLQLQLRDVGTAIDALHSKHSAVTSELAEHREVSQRADKQSARAVETLSAFKPLVTALAEQQKVQTKSQSKLEKAQIRHAENVLTQLEQHEVKMTEKLHIAGTAGSATTNDPTSASAHMSRQHLSIQMAFLQDAHARAQAATEAARAVHIQRLFDQHDGSENADEAAGGPQHPRRVGAGIGSNQERTPFHEHEQKELETQIAALVRREESIRELLEELTDSWTNTAPAATEGADREEETEIGAEPEAEAEAEAETALTAAEDGRLCVAAAAFHSEGMLQSRLDSSASDPPNMSSGLTTGPRRTNAVAAMAAAASELTRLSTSSDSGSNTSTSSASGEVSRALQKFLSEFGELQRIDSAATATAATAEGDRREYPHRAGGSASAGAGTGVHIRSSAADDGARPAAAGRKGRREQRRSVDDGCVPTRYAPHFRRAGAPTRRTSSAAGAGAGADVVEMAESEKFGRRARSISPARTYAYSYTSARPGRLDLPFHPIHLPPKTRAEQRAKDARRSNTYAEQRLQTLNESFGQSLFLPTASLGLGLGVGATAAAGAGAGAGAGIYLHDAAAGMASDALRNSSISGISDGVLNTTTGEIHRMRYLSPHFSQAQSQGLLRGRGRGHMLAGIWLPNHTAPYARDTSPERLCPPRTQRSVALSQVAGVTGGGGSEHGSRPRDSSPRNYGIEVSNAHVFNLRFPTFSGRVGAGAGAGAELGTELSDVPSSSSSSSSSSAAAALPTLRTLGGGRSQEHARGESETKQRSKQAKL